MQLGLFETEGLVVSKRDTGLLLAMHGQWFEFVWARNLGALETNSLQTLHCGLCSGKMP